MRLTITSLALCTALLAPTAQAAQWEALPQTAPAPADNPSTDAKVALGKMLYFDPRLSSTGTVSCNSCHNVMEGGDDDRNLSMGVNGQLGARSAPTVWNSAFHSVQFWDGRAPSLEEQAKGPMTNPVEMGMKDHDAVMQRIQELDGYKAHFIKAFGEKNPMNIENTVKAIAAFERTLITPNSAYDRYVTGDKKALNAQQIRGMNTFASTGCVACHSGAAFNGPSMPAGTGFYQKFPTFTDNSYVSKYKFMDDKGRGGVTGKSYEDHMFRVPTLRNIADTAPYFHNGAVTTLNEAVHVMAKTQLNKDLSDKDAADIVAFLNALSGPYPKIVAPRLPSRSDTSVVMNQELK